MSAQLADIKHGIMSSKDAQIPQVSEHAPPLAEDELSDLDDSDEGQVSYTRPSQGSSQSPLHELCNNNNDYDDEDVVASIIPKSNESECKVLVIGATNSGKTSLIEKFLTGKNTEARTTLCIEISKAIIPVGANSQAKQDVPFVIYDMAGMRKFQSHNAPYYADVFAVLFVFDVTCRISLNFTINWLEDYSNFCRRAQISPSEKILVCNKCDLENAAMSRDELMEFARQSGMTSAVECSAKSGQNVDSLFTYIAEKFVSSRNSPNGS